MDDPGLRENASKLAATTAHISGGDASARVWKSGIIPNSLQDLVHPEKQRILSLLLGVAPLFS